jgi:archaetidylinositol phosphate synthase
MATIVFKEAHREVLGATASVEKRILTYLAGRLPRSVQSDHLTALGLLATMLVAAAYALSRWDTAWLHVVNAGLVLNWFGDSLDGTLARHRRCERPRYGFYADHIIDAVGAVLVIGGLAASGLMSWPVAALLLAAYDLMAIHTYLATYTAGTFKISYGAVGGTELRLILAAANLLVMVQPAVTIAGVSLLVFDVVGVLAALGLAVLAMVVVSKTSILLRRQDTAAAGVRGNG